MSRVLERRRLLLSLMRQVTLEQGSFGIAEIAGRTALPRSTVQDWVKRLVAEGCVAAQTDSRGRHGARFVAISAMPRSTCRRVFTTVDKDRVAIFHKCLSSACAGFCAHHHRVAGGVIDAVERDGNLLRETLIPTGAGRDRSFSTLRGRRRACREGIWVQELLSMADPPTTR